MSVRALVVGLFAVGAMFVGVSKASASPQDEARAHYQKGNSLYQAGKYDRAIRQFKLADKKSPSPILSFNIGLCHERLGNVDDAIRYYQSYLNQVPNAANRADVEASLSKLRQQKASKAKASRPSKGAKKRPPAKGPPAKGPVAEVAPPVGPAQGDRASEDGNPEDGAPAEPPMSKPQTNYAYNGPDAGLRRVAAIDIDAIRAKYKGQR